MLQLFYNYNATARKKKIKENENNLRNEIENIETFCINCSQFVKRSSHMHFAIYIY